ncbi:hypothetical protein [Aquisalinus flavus]|uniref:Uncharacterized protein n=1 Tax=Aquisalinus flavus TaxID=1526572 RepID=A0A8J2V415_9PROT|nr:hypothetical protein [Aquisalinus flavus]MBD0427509.1 hypothetical protein [Aquisalinus flavus]UNE47304.1 hypothetical protein FF099_04135 [Aquisalinus flavus]GGD01545.1 hypothetical protein GCM10011342_08220 [Aquisalinus flavus]
MAHTHDLDMDKDGQRRTGASVSRLPYPVEGDADFDGEDFDPPLRRDPSSWERASVQVKFWFRTAAIIFICCFVVGWPVGMSLSAYNRTGLFSIEFGLTFPILAIVIALAALIYIIGQMLSLSFRMIAKAEELEMSSSRFTMPETHAVTNVRSVGKAVRSEITALNSYLDDALIKLASAESMIRQQVQAIDTVGSSLRGGNDDLVGSVAREREKLIELTEMMNTQADAFAEAIAEKAKLGEEHSRAANERVSGAEAELEARLTRLEETAEKALTAFETLATSFEERRHKVEESGSAFANLSKEAVDKSASVTKAFQENTEAISAAQARLHEESERLEQLITQQRERADKLAEAIARQTEKLSSLSEKKERADRLEAARAEAARNLAPKAPKRPISIMRIEEDVQEDLPRASLRPDLSARPPAPSVRPDQPASGPSGAGQPSRTGEKPEAEKSFIAERPVPPAPPRGAIFGAGTTIQKNGDRREPTLTRPDMPASREERQSTSWRDILAAADDPETPSEARGQSQLRLQQVTTAAPSSPVTRQEPDQADSDIVWLIRQMQSFMVEIETRLYGRPDTDKLVRYKNGERNIFANELLRRDDMEFRRKLKAEVDRNEIFERAVFDFLANFDALLEPDEDGDDADGLIDDYLGSPLGQVYVLVGGALDYFG